MMHYSSGRIDLKEVVMKHLFVEKNLKIEPGQPFTLYGPNSRIEFSFADLYEENDEWVYSVTAFSGPLEVDLEDMAINFIEEYAIWYREMDQTRW